MFLLPRMKSKLSTEATDCHQFPASPLTGAMLTIDVLCLTLLSEFHHLCCNTVEHNTVERTNCNNMCKNALLKKHTHTHTFFLSDMLLTFR